MAKHVLRNLDLTEHDVVEAERGTLLQPGGRPVVTQAAMRALLQAQDEADRLAALVRKALMDGADTEDGDLDAGLFVEQEKKVNWRAAFVRVGGDAAAEVEATPRTPTAPRLRVGQRDEKFKGQRVAPTETGEPVQGARSTTDESQAA